jgi:hypothetical protein
MRGTKEQRRDIIELIKGPRGRDFLKCFEDMSMREASKICNISFASWKRAKELNKIEMWGFHELRSGRQHPSKWHEIRAFRNSMMKDDFFKNFRCFLEQASRRGHMHAAIGLKSEPTSAFTQGAKKHVAEQEIKKAVKEMSAASVIANPHAMQDSRTWSVFTSLNQQAIEQTLNLQQAQMERLAQLAQEARQIMEGLPPPIFIKSQPPSGAILSQPPPAASVVKVCLPSDAPVPRALPRSADSARPVYAEAAVQASRTEIRRAQEDALTWAVARPREIGAQPGPTWDPAHPDDTRKAKALEVRPWMIAADMMFSCIPKTITASGIRTVLHAHYESMRTPLWLYTGAEDYMRTRHGLAQYGMESVLVSRGGEDALPQLEPITDWRWLAATA